MTAIERNLPLWLQPAQIFTLHPDNNHLSDGKAQNERRHGRGNDPEIPFSSHPDHAAYRALTLTQQERDLMGQIDIWLTPPPALHGFPETESGDNRAYKWALFNRAAAPVALAIAGLTVAAMIYCILHS